MKLLYSACLATILLATFAFFQAQTIKQINDPVFEGEQASKHRTAELDKTANGHLELLAPTHVLEKQLLAVAHAPSTAGIENFGAADLDQFDSRPQEKTNQDRVRTIVTSDNSSIKLMLNIPSGSGPTWKPIEELRGSIENLDQELNFAIDSQDQEFRIVDIKAYDNFLNNIGIDSTTKQNILAQLVDANIEGFSMLLADAVELQVNGYVAAIKYWQNGDGVEKPSQMFSPAHVMDTNLSLQQLQQFSDFEAARQSQRVDSTDERIVNLLEKLDLIP